MQVLYKLKELSGKLDELDMISIMYLCGIGKIRFGTIEEECPIDNKIAALSCCISNLNQQIHVKSEIFFNLIPWQWEAKQYCQVSFV